MYKNIWIINHYASMPNQSNGARHYNLAKQLVNQGYDVTIFHSSAVHNSKYNSITDNSLYRIDDYCGIKFVSVKTDNYDKNNFKRIQNILQFYHRVKVVAKKIMKENSPDVIIGSSMHPLTLYAASRIAKMGSCKYIIEIRDLWPETFLSIKPNFSKLILKFFYSLERRIYLEADKLIFVMEGGYDYLVERGWEKDFDRKNVYYINNGVDIELFEKNKATYKIENNDLANEKIFKVVYTGSIGLVNNLGLLLDVAEYIDNKGLDDIKFLIWGQGPQRSELEKSCVERNIKNVVFEGTVEKRYIPYIISHADINIIQNRALAVHRFGTSENKKFEYLAAGKPIIKIGYNGYDIIEEHMAGVTITDVTVKAIAETVIRFYNMNSSEYDEYSSNAKKLAKEYDFNILSQKLINAIED